MQTLFKRAIFDTYPENHQIITQVITVKIIYIYKGQYKVFMMCVNYLS